MALKSSLAIRFDTDRENGVSTTMGISGKRCLTLFAH